MYARIKADLFIVRNLCYMSAMCNSVIF